MQFSVYTTETRVARTAISFEFPLDGRLKHESKEKGREGGRAHMSYTILRLPHAFFYQLQEMGVSVLVLVLGVDGGGGGAVHPGRKECERRREGRSWRGRDLELKRASLFFLLKTRRGNCLVSIFAIWGLR